jgi:tRNA(Ile)-lysidine synthase
VSHSPELATRIANTIREQQLFNRGDTVIIGLSGGADSTALLDLLANLPDMPLRLIAAHLNHCLRSADSDVDEAFCRALAERYMIPFESRRIDVQGYADDNALNLEDAGRRARIAFFDELLAVHQASAVALAHHADDQAETVLMRLLRGSGLTGLSGMSYRNSRGYVRPMLGITRAEIEAHLLARGLTWREDASNLDRTFLRNRIRHELLPLLEQYNPAIRSGLATTAGIVSSENEFLTEQASLAVDQISHMTGQNISCSIDQLGSFHISLQRRIIRQMLSRLQGNLEQISYHHIDAIRHMIMSTRPNSSISLPKNIIVSKEYDTVNFRIKDSGHQQQFHSMIPCPGIYRLPCNYELTVEQVAFPERVDETSGSTAFIDLDKAPFPWHVRTFRSGDRIQQLGMTGRKKVQDIFIDNKIPPLQRKSTPLVFCKEELIWVCGLRTSHRTRLDNKSSSIIRMVFSHHE